MMQQREGWQIEIKKDKIQPPINLRYVQDGWNKDDQIVLKKWRIWIYTYGMLNMWSECIVHYIVKVNKIYLKYKINNFLIWRILFF